MTPLQRGADDSLGEWQASHNAIILVKPAVMSPQRDITNEIRADIARRTQGASEKTTAADGLMLLMLSAGSGAKDLGTWGNVFEPAEQDMLAFIQNRLKGMEQTANLTGCGRRQRKE
jgi:hypothetical protein